MYVQNESISQFKKKKDLEDRKNEKRGEKR